MIDDGDLAAAAVGEHHVIERDIAADVVELHGFLHIPYFRLGIEQQEGSAARRAVPLA